MIEPTPWERWQEIGLGAMGMTEAEFFGQSIILWRRRLTGFNELHGGGARDEPMTLADLAKLEEQFPDEAPPIPQ